MDFPSALPAPSLPPSADLKRKRTGSPATASSAPPPPPAKISRANSTAGSNNHLQINYLARQQPTDLSLISTDDTLPNVLKLVSEYAAVLDRHESLASNLGARPLGPNLLKRFERLFDGPPKILASHSHAKSPSAATASPQLTWLDVIEFARTKPEQFQLGQMSEGVRVCQFYWSKGQCRVQISEEDFLFVKSGRCEDLVPPLPIWEDEEKEVGTLEILERALEGVRAVADQVAARVRQLNHRLKGRKTAILERRAANPSIRADFARFPSPTRTTSANGASPAVSPSQTANEALAGLANAHPSSGFVAVNSRPASDANGSRLHHTSVSNGNTVPSNSGTSPAVRNELLNTFRTNTERRRSSVDARPHRPSATPAASPANGLSGPAPHTIASISSFRPASFSDTHDFDGPGSTLPTATTNTLTSPPPPTLRPSISRQLTATSTPSTPAASTPSANPIRPPLLTHQNSSATDASGPDPPYRALMLSRMEKLPRGARLIPPCDRCRRLQMDCLKNLTACAGCTKKHARCAWRDVCDAEVELLREGVEEVGQGPGIAMGLGSGEAERLMRMDVDGLAGARELARRASTTPAPLVVGDTARAAAVGEGRDTDKDTDVDVAGGRTTSIEKAAPEGGLMATAVMTATADETANAFAGDADAMQQDPLVPQRLPPGAEEAPGPKQELGGSTTGLDAEVDTGIALPSQSMAV